MIERLYDVGAAVRQHPAPWPHLEERCDVAKATCSIEGCDKPSRKRTWCEMHYGRWERTGDPLALRRTPAGALCAIDGCDRPNRGRGLCSTHYQRMRSYGDPTILPTKTPDGAPLAWLRDAVASRSRLGCWDWPYATNDLGYGKVWYQGRMPYAHRLACELDGRPIPDGLFGRHRCDRPVCCNPDHIEPGTQRDNLRDMVDRGRARVGSRNAASKLTEGQVVEIRTMYASGRSVDALAEAYPVRREQILRIVRRLAWKHVGGAR